MARIIKVAAGQLGPIQRAEGRDVAVSRMLELMKEAHARGCNLIVFPELALTTFFPRWYVEDQDEVDRWFEPQMPNPQVQPLFDAARRYAMGFYLGYAELVQEDGRTHHYNTAILVDRSGTIVGRYRKVHLPGHSDYDTARKWQHLEKRYFEVGNLGFPVFETMGGRFGMCICNDRRWPETYRVMGLDKVEMVLLGYNTPTHNSLSDDEDPELRMFHNHLGMQAGAYQNSTWVVGVAKAGNEDGFDLDACVFGRETIFNFAAHRRPEHYGAITAPVRK